MKINADKAFLKRANKLLKRNPELKKAYLEFYAKLACNPFDPALHTHGLSGNLKGKFACSLTHDLRVIFIMNEDVIYLLDIGSHDEVY